MFYIWCFVAKAILKEAQQHNRCLMVYVFTEKIILVCLITL